nr:hypothetical protein [Lentilactobacillus sp. SPB1-3]MCZ0977803.1 hypothetical protein [Lentilactobacillus sp. SPB1-3]
MRKQFERGAIMGGNYSTTIKRFDADLAKWSLNKTNSLSEKQLLIYRALPNLYFQKYVS